ncbi:hypothetical protein G6F56_007475 [Rhizopus delemar]|nr:hypothetical protein G6F56_007475 [Rhizopus delemar]
MPQLSNEDKTRIIDHFELGQSQKDIALKFNTSAGTKKLPMEASKWLISLELHNMRMHKRSAARKPFINEKYRKARLAFAKEHKNWTLEQWQKVIWTNESSVEIEKDVLPKGNIHKRKKFHYGLGWNSVRKEVTSCHYAKRKEEECGLCRTCMQSSIARLLQQRLGCYSDGRQRTDSHVLVSRGRGQGRAAIPTITHQSVRRPCVANENPSRNSTLRSDFTSEHRSSQRDRSLIADHASFRDYFLGLVNATLAAIDNKTFGDVSIQEAARNVRKIQRILAGNHPSLDDDADIFGRGEDDIVEEYEDTDPS